MSSARPAGSILALAAATALLAAAPGTAGAQTTAHDQAQHANDEGKKLFAEQRYLEAYKRFRDAAQLAPEGRYFFNMCFALNYLERYHEAITACEQVEIAGADAELLEKTRTVLAALREKAPQQPPPAQPVSDPSTGEPTVPAPTTATDQPGTNTAVQPTPAYSGPIVPGDPFAVTSTAKVGEYKWALGGELGGYRNLGIGDRGNGQEYYGAAGQHIHLFANFIMSESRRLGLQAFLNFSGLSPGDANTDSFRLNIVDFGAAAYVNRPLTERFSWTPLAGLFLSLMDPEETIDETLLGVGLRGEISLAYALGSRGQHTITATPAINLYSPASGGNASIRPRDYGLDQGGAALSLSFGYQYRFSSPFGSVPLITLE